MQRGAQHVHTGTQDTRRKAAIDEAMTHYRHCSLENSTASQYTWHVQLFKRVARDHGLPQRPPVTLDHLEALAFEYVHRRRNLVSSLEVVVNGIKWWARRTYMGAGDAWLPLAYERRAWDDTVAGMEKVHGVPPKGARPLFAEDLVHMLEAIPKAGDQSQMRAMLALSYATMCRADNLIDAGLTMDRVTFDAEQGDFYIKWHSSKANRNRTRVDVSIVLNERRVGADGHPLANPARLLTSYLHGAGLWQAMLEQDPDVLLFPKLTSAGTVANHRKLAVARSTWGRRIKRWQGLAGIPADDQGRGYTPHSCRVGSCTDSWAAGMSVQSIMQQGCWRSDAWQRYCRPTPAQRARAQRRTRSRIHTYTGWREHLRNAATGPGTPRKRTGRADDTHASSHGRVPSAQRQCHEARGWFSRDGED